MIEMDFISKVPVNSLIWHLLVDKKWNFGVGFKSRPTIARFCVFLLIFNSKL